MTVSFRLYSIMLGALLSVAAMNSLAQQTASYAVTTDLKFSTDQRTRGISDSLNRPGAKLSIQAVHESGFLGLAELSTASKKQFLNGGGSALTLAAGYRVGDPDGWHYGIGAAAEVFPGAKFEAPHGFDFNTGTVTDWRSSKYDSTFALIEIGYGALEARILNSLSKNYRGANTGSVCGTMLALMPDPSAALECYARGDRGSRGSWLYDVGYKHSLSPTTTLNLHAGYQKIANFNEANFSDYSVGIAHKRWGFNWSAEWFTTRTKVRELYVVSDGAQTRATDNNRFVVSVSRSF